MRPLVALLSASLLAVPLVVGEHVQTDFEHEASFDHVKGNEWWVEVDVDHSGELHGVDARDDNGDWVPLEKRSWGVWAGSFHIEPGHDVRFRTQQGDFGRIESCWFTHPEGQERCQSDWHVTVVDRAGDGVYLHDNAFSDADNDGTEELVVTSGDGIRLYAFEGGWSLQETLVPGEGFSTLSIGDLDADGRTDVVAEAIAFDVEFTRFEHDGTAWQRMDYTGPANGGSALTVGDPDDDGVDAVFLADHGDHVPVYEVRLVDGAWQEQEIVRVAEGVGILHVGDGDGDGDDELYAGGGYKGDDSLFQIEHEDGMWIKTQIGTEHGSNSVFAIGTGDADGDGRSELYHTTEDPDHESEGFEYSLWKNSFAGGGWTQESIATFLADDYPYTALVADADNDGTDEIHVAVTGHDDLRIVQVEKTPTGWSKDRVVVANGGGEPSLAAGDPDGDGLVEIASVEERRDGFVQVLSEHAPGGGTSGPFTFDHTGGNEWWVQVKVTGPEPSRVQSMDTGGAWKELEKKDWGDWAASYHIEPGHDVRFRASDGATWHESCWFTHPDGVTPDGDGTCTGPEDGSGGGGSGDFDASFSTPGGNEWWVEVYVDANEPLAGVDARDDGGAWVALEKRSWGAWAKSFHVEDGSLVDFRATSTDGDQDISGKYRWPEGTQVTEEPDEGKEEPPPPGDAEIAFGPKASNEWWVETMVAVNGTIVTVEARADDGSWHMLEHKDWGSWATSFHAPDGSVVEFRATLEDGSAATSDGFTWPEAEVVGGTGAWPEEGSYAHYDVSRSSPAGAYDYTATYIFHDGAWRVDCEGTLSFRGADTAYKEYRDEAPPASESGTGPRQGQPATMGACGQHTSQVTVSHVDDTQTHQNGDDCLAETWFATRIEDDLQEKIEFSTYVDLMTDWHHDAPDDQQTGHLEDTNAPLRCGA